MSKSLQVCLSNGQISPLLIRFLKLNGRLFFAVKNIYDAILGCKDETILSLCTVCFGLEMHNVTNNYIQSNKYITFTPEIMKTA